MCGSKRGFVKEKGLETRGQKDLVGAKVATLLSNVSLPEVARLACASSLWSVSSGVAVPVCACWHWGFGGLPMVMLGSIVTCIFAGRLISLLVTFQLVLSVRELVASIN